MRAVKNFYLLSAINGKSYKIETQGACSKGCRKVVEEKRATGPFLDPRPMVNIHRNFKKDSFSR